MRKGRFTEEQMVAIIREADREQVSVVAKRHGVSEQTIYVWRKRFGSFEANDVRRLRQLEAENARLKKLVVERDLEIEVDEGSRLKKLVGVPARRRQVTYGRERGLSVRRACTLFSVARSALRYESRKAAADAPAIERMTALAAQYPRYGYRRIRIFLGRDGHRMSPGTRVAAVASGALAGAAQAAEETRRCGSAAAAGSIRAEPGVVVRLRVRPLRQRTAAQMPDGHRRVHQGGPGD